jgi:hypothetical protein
MKFLLSLVLLLVSAVCMGADHIVIVLDTSASMNEYMRSAKKSRMEVAKESLTEVLLEELSPNTKVGILTFSGWSYDLQEVDRENLKKAINGAIPSGGTPLYEAIKKGATRLLEERRKQGNVGGYKLLVVTDGQAQDNQLNNSFTNQNGATVPGVMEDVLHRFIVVDVIGLDMMQDHMLKTQINGFYMPGGSKEGLKRGVRKSLVEVGSKADNSVADEEVFAEVAALPEAFARSSVRALTDFQNQPIGELPPVEKPMVEEQTSTSTQPAADAPAAQSSGLSALGIVCILSIVVVVVLFLVGAAVANG